MAPPTAIIESWRGVKLRCSPASRSTRRFGSAGLATRGTSLYAMERHANRRSFRQPPAVGKHFRLNQRTVTDGQVNEVASLYFRTFRNASVFSTIAGVANCR